MTAETQEVNVQDEAQTANTDSLIGEQTPTEAPESGSLLAPEATAEVKPAEPTPEWYYDKDVPGEGKRPEWMDDKFQEQYGDIMTAAKGVSGLRSKLGGFTGAPEDGYTYEISEEFSGALEFDEENPLYQSFSKFAQEKNMSQETFKQCLDLYTANQYMELQSESQDNTVNAQTEIQKLGDNFEERKQGLEAWVRESMPEAEAVHIINNVKTADQFQLLEQMKRGSSQSTMPLSSHNVSSGPTLEEYREVQADPRYQHGTAFYKDAFERVVKPFLTKSSAERAKR